MKRRETLVCLLMAATCLAGPAAARAQDTKIYACADSKGRLRVVSDPAECNTRETLVSWDSVAASTAGIRVLDSSGIPQQVGNWLGAMGGHAQVGFRATLPNGQALTMALPVAPSGFIAGGEMFFPVDSNLIINAYLACQSASDFQACMLAAFQQALAAGEICQGDPYLPATAPDPLSPAAFFDTTIILGSQADLYRADVGATPVTVGLSIPGVGTVLFVYAVDPVDPTLRCTLEIRPDGPGQAYPVTRVLSLYTLFTPPFSIGLDSSDGS